MANYANLIALVNDAIKTNGIQAITGQLLQTVLDEMIGSLGTGYQFAGLASPGSVAPSTDAKIFLFASEAGEYSNFHDSYGNPIELAEGELAILANGTYWTKYVIATLPLSSLTISTDVPDLSYNESEPQTIADQMGQSIADVLATGAVRFVGDVAVSYYKVIGYYGAEGGYITFIGTDKVYQYDVDANGYITDTKVTSLAPDNALSETSENAVQNKVVKAALDAMNAAKQDVLTFDDVPTENSNNPVKSGGVKTALNELGQELSNVQLFLEMTKTIPVYGITTGKQIRTNGSIYDAANAAYTSLIHLNKDDIIYVKAIGINYLTSIISVKQANDLYISVVGYTDGVDEYTWQAPSDCYVAISYATSQSPTIIVYSSGIYKDTDDLKLKSESLKLVKNVESLPVFANAAIGATTGIAAFNSNFVLFGPIEIHRGDLLEYYTILNTANLGVVSELQPGDDATSIYYDVLIASTNEKVYNGTIFFDHDCNIVIGCLADSAASANVYKSNIISPNYYNIEQYDNVIKTIPEYSEISGAYDKNTFTPRPNASQYAYTTPIHLHANDLLVVRCRQDVAYNAIALCTKDGTPYKTISAGINRDTQNTYTYRAYNECYVLVGFKKIQNSTRQYQRHIAIYSSNQATSLAERFIYGNDFFRLFYSNCICIGDSVTYGAVDDYPREPDTIWAHNNLSYPARLAKLTGWVVENAGASGYSAYDWYYDTYNRNVGFAHWDYTNYDIALIELGLNNGFTDTLVADTFNGVAWQPNTQYAVGDKVMYNGIGKSCIQAHTSGSTFDSSKWDNAYASYADTNTGCYCKIIEGMRIANPHIAIVIIVSSWLREAFTNMNAAKVLYQIAERYNLPVIDLDLDYPINLGDIKYHGIRPVSPYNSIDRVHFNPIGYLAKAGSIYMQLMQVITNNAKDLNDTKTY